MSWLEPAETSAPRMMQRYLTVDLSGLDNGEHHLVVEVERASGAVASAARTIHISR